MPKRAQRLAMCGAIVYMQLEIGPDGPVWSDSPVKYKRGRQIISELCQDFCRLCLEVLQGILL